MSDPNAFQSGGAQVPYNQVQSAQQQAAQQNEFMVNFDYVDEFHDVILNEIIKLVCLYSELSLFAG